MTSISPHTPVPDEEQTLRRAIAHRPDDAHAHAALASFLCGTGRVDAALAHIDHEVRRHPAKLWPLSIKAGILSSERRAAEAIAVHRLLVAMAPDVPLIWANFASDLAAVGEVDEAAAAFRSAVRRAPDHGAAWLGLASLPGVSFDDADLAAMERGAALSPDPHQKIQLLLALGRGYGAHGLIDMSFAKFSEAKALRETLVPYDADRIAALVDAHVLSGASLFAAAPPVQAQASGPIFIVGMPRSGSTLVEQIVGSHPDIEAMGELFALQDVAGSIGALADPDAFVRRIGTLTPADAAELGARYLEGAGRYRRTDRPFFTDKMPANWRFVALIHRILPGARIVDVRREALACCFSAYTTHFNRHTEFPNSLADLGAYYRHYVRMMDMARNAAPDRIFPLDHARLLSDAEREIRALLRFLHLSFAPSCLKPEDNRRAIYTPSAQQVRSAIAPLADRSRAYAPWLGPLKNALGQGTD